ncbi:MAG TPA: DUF4252 domain-containing protein [Thermoanaerobaculia bacterium]|jgi:hypothetical protein
MRKTIILTIALLLLAASSGLAQKLEDQPGYLPIEQLDLFPADKLSVEVNLEGIVLRMIAEATRREDPGFSAVVAGLKSIKVQVFPLAGVDAGSIKTRIGRAVRWLEDRGWQSTLKVREQGEETYIYTKESDGKIAGLTLLSMEPGDEAVVINIVGRIDPAQIGRLGQSLDIPQLERVPASGKKPE